MATAAAPMGVMVGGRSVLIRISMRSMSTCTICKKGGMDGEKREGWMSDEGYLLILSADTSRDEVRCNAGKR